MEGFKTRKQILIFILVFFIAAFFISTDGIFQMATGRDFIYGHSIMEGGRVTASFRHANDFGAYLIVVASLLLSMSLYLFLPPRWVSRRNIEIFPFMKKYFWFPKIITLIAFILAIVCTGVTYSRGVWFGFGIALVFYGAQRIRTMPFLILLVVLFFTVFLPRMAANRHVSFVSDDVVSDVAVSRKAAEGQDLSKNTEDHQDKIGNGREKIADDPAKIVNGQGKFVAPWKNFGAMGRYAWWKEAVNIIRNYPTFGTGLNTYSKMTTKFESMSGGYAHNCYLQMAAEIGILGLLVFLWITFSLYRTILRNINQYHDSVLEVISLGLLSGLTGFLAHSFIDTNLYSVQLANFFWLLLGVVMCIQRIETAKEEKRLTK